MKRWFLEGWAEVLLTAVSLNLDAANIPRYEVFEAVLTSTKSYGNPFRDVTVTATFTAPSGHKLTAYGFHDGGSTWRLRMAPDEAGQWRYITAASNAGDTGLDGESGSFECMPSAHKGFIRPDPKWKYYFSFSDGTPFFPMVDACFWMTAGLTDTQRGTYFDTRQAQGFNVIWFSVEPGTKHANATMPVSGTWRRITTWSNDFRALHPAI